MRGGIPWSGRQAVVCLLLLYGPSASSAQPASSPGGTVVLPAAVTEAEVRELEEG